MKKKKFIILADISLEEANRNKQLAGIALSYFLKYLFNNEEFNIRFDKLKQIYNKEVYSEECIEKYMDDVGWSYRRYDEFYLVQKNNTQIFYDPLSLIRSKKEYFDDELKSLSNEYFIKDRLVELKSFLCTNLPLPIFELNFNPIRIVNKFQFLGSATKVPMVNNIFIELVNITKVSQLKTWIKQNEKLLNEKLNEKKFHYGGENEKYELLRLITYMKRIRKFKSYEQILNGFHSMKLPLGVDIESIIRSLYRTKFVQ